MIINQSSVVPTRDPRVPTFSLFLFECFLGLVLSFLTRIFKSESPDYPSQLLYGSCPVEIA